MVRAVQILPDNNILDGAHNEAGIVKLQDSLNTMFGSQKYCIIFGFFLDKDYKNSLKLLANLADEFYLVPVTNSMNREYVNPQKLKEDLLQLGFNKDKLKTFNSVSNALDCNSKKRKIIIGSLFLQQYVLRSYYSDEEIINLNKTRFMTT